MATQSEKVNSQLQMILDDGVDEQGNPLFRTKSFNNVKTTATDDQLHNVAVALEGLQQRIMQKVERNDSFEITNI
ncbi:DUF1659 domain-containing protein [Halobacillus yeomjeoni]|uniref:DUF1659 domain-containing protein n=1 Tax=Halobacillus yeomjeoni TaxID=311194 RepID=A0A931MU01_9BACI|nr:DUF1659 domain-containing protein [Halobacillus yeomjeoni]MBH0228945.1 DUF1659 domain-containing protein [Halobacillus yeomjeoni]MCA0983676.1 DUF1659 domain-containing protein [Halobacillus yeomjeoni]